MLQRTLGQARQLVEATLKAKERSIAYTRGRCEQLTSNGVIQSSELIRHTRTTALRVPQATLEVLEMVSPACSPSNTGFHQPPSQCDAIRPLFVPRPFNPARSELSAAAKVITTLSIM